MRYAVLACWMIGGLYAGTAGWARSNVEQAVEIARPGSDTQGAVVCDGINFSSLEDCVAFQREKQANTLFPWIFYLPAFFGTMIMVLGFGALGGSARVLWDIAGPKSLSRSQTLAIPPLGAIAGLVVLGAAYVIPVALTVNGSVLRPQTVAFLAMFGGIFPDRLFDWIGEQFGRIFGTRKSHGREHDS